MFTARPQVAAGEAAEHRRPACISAFALQGVKDFFDSIAHKTRSSNGWVVRFLYMVVLDMSPENESAMCAGLTHMAIYFNGSTKSLESRIQLVDVTTFGRCVDKAGFKAVACQQVGVISLHARGGKSLGEVIVHVAAEVGRVV